MLSFDYFLTSMLFTNINKIATGHWLYDLVLTMLLMSFIGLLMNENFRGDLYHKLYVLWNRMDKYNTITFSSSDKEVSQRYRALMNYISQTNDPTVKGLFEVEMKKYNPRTDYDEYHSSVYRVSQNKRFKITPEIDGRVYWSSKDKTEYNGKVSYVEYQNLEIGSSKKTMKELIMWVDHIEKEYKQYLKSKMLETQTLVQVNWNSKEDCIEAFYTPWESNVTFANRFFTNKNEILEKINFFLNNEEWYKERGIPWTLGILLWGDPGCGKTGFIKALMNLTKRHGVDIKLNTKFEMERLKEVICDDQIAEDIIIPQKNRILLFEDIDAMGEVVKDRDLPKDSSEIDIEKKISEAIQKTTNSRLKRRGRRSDEDDDYCFVEKKGNSDNNNLSYFLNILDGLNECPGRIIIMTTNKPEYLDKALIRPGRIDFKIHMTKATVVDINDILNFYWKTDNNYEINSEWEQKLSHAEVISCCRQASTPLETIKNIEKWIYIKEIENIKLPKSESEDKLAISPESSPESSEDGEEET